MSEETRTELTDVWNELQNVKLKLIRIENKLDEFIVNIDNIKQNFLLALEEYDRMLQEEENGKNS